MRSFRPLVLSLALAALIPMTLHAQSTSQAPLADNDGTLLSISADATAKRVPDVATISTGVVTRGADANAAMRANANQMTKVMAAIKAAGVAERDIQTSGVNLNPNYVYAQNQPPKINGYEARNTVSLKVRDISRLGKVMDSLVAAGANDLNGPAFEVDKPDEAYDEARRDALEKAQARAGMYAKALGLRVRRIVSIDESGSGFPHPIPMMRMTAMAAAPKADTEVAPGETSLSAHLNVVFELGR